MNSNEHVVKSNESLVVDFPSCIAIIKQTGLRPVAPEWRFATSVIVAAKTAGDLIISLKAQASHSSREQIE